MTQPIDINALRARASHAFDAAFRDELANAVTRQLLSEPGSVGCGQNCICPLGCLTWRYRPSASHLQPMYPRFSVHQFAWFSLAFDEKVDCDTPESALGLLYRLRLEKP